MISESDKSIAVCDGCDQEEPVSGYVITGFDDVEHNVMYCADCARLAAINFNGETKSIRLAST